MVSPYSTPPVHSRLPPKIPRIDCAASPFSREVRPEHEAAEQCQAKGRVDEEAGHREGVQLDGTPRLGVRQRRLGEPGGSPATWSS